MSRYIVQPDIDNNETDQFPLGYIIIIGTVVSILQFTLFNKLGNFFKK